MRHLLSAALLIPATASAAYPEDVSLSGMTEHGGVQVVDTELISSSYQTLVRELGVTLANRTLPPAATLGASGFEIMFGSTVGFNNRRNVGNDISAWSRAHADETPGGPLFTPTLQIRKGLPLSLEVGLDVAWLGNTRQAAVSGYVRGAIVERYAPWPDINLRMGYTGYVGNDELEVGALDFGVTIGTELSVGRANSINTMTFSPFLYIGGISINGASVLDTDTAAALQLPPIGRGGSDTTALPAIVTGQFSGGLEFKGEHFVLRLSGGYALNAIPTVSAAFGFTF